jgi:hypothetical protein
VRAARACPADPTPWIALLTLRHTEDAWREVVARDPWNRSAYHEVLHHLSPLRAGPAGGSVVEMTHFARRSAHSAPYGSPLVLLPLAARAERAGHSRGSGTPDALSSAVWQERGVTGEIDAALDRWFRPAGPANAQAVADLNILAFALTRTHRSAEAAPVFRRIGRHMTMYPWDTLPDPVAAFLRWQDRAARP